MESRALASAAAPRARRTRVRRPASLVGVISDTHGLLRPEAIMALQGAELIVHAGDVGAPDVLAQLADIAPVLAVRGNNDREPWARKIPLTRTFDVCGLRIHVLHDLHELGKDAARAGYAVVISGHSHRPSVVERDGVLYVNPGSAGPRRFTLPVTIARLSITRGALRPAIVELVPAAPSAGRV